MFDEYGRFICPPCGDVSDGRSIGTAWDSYTKEKVPIGYGGMSLEEFGEREEREMHEEFRK